MSRRSYITTGEDITADYYIYNIDDFKELRDRVNNGTESSGTRFPNGTTGYEGKVFVMANDIDFDNCLWESIGTHTSQRPFKGTLDGNHYKITNFKTKNNVSNANTDCFMVCSNATIRNLTIQGSFSLTVNTQCGLFMSLGNSTFSKIVFDVDIYNIVNMIYCIIGVDSDYCVDIFNFGNFTVGNTGYNGCGMLCVGGIVERCANYGNLQYDGSRTGGLRQTTMIKNRVGNPVVRNCLNAGNLSNSLNANYGIAQGANEITNSLYCGAFGACTSDSGYIADTTPTTYSNNFYDSTKNTTVLLGYNGNGMTTTNLKSGVDVFNNTADWIYEPGYYPRLNNWLKDDIRTKI